MPPLTELVPPDPDLRQAVEYVCTRDRAFAAIETEVGPLTVRRWPPGFASLVRIIVGQQLSTRAARAIFQRLNQLTELTPAQFTACSDAALKAAGLSRAKIATCRGLSEAIATHRLALDALPQLSDALVTEQLTQIKGIGPWTAEIYLLFCLGRLSSFPASDLAIQRAYQRLKALEDRPSRQGLLEMTTPLEPCRGAAAHLLWHYYRLLPN